MAMYEGPGDTRSAYEAMKRIRDGNGPHKFLGGVLLAIVAAYFLFFIAASLFAGDHKREPIKAHIIEAQVSDSCIVQDDRYADKGDKYRSLLTTGSPALFARCQRYKGAHVDITFDESTGRVSGIEPIK